MDCLKFGAEGAYGQFRRPYTTTSALTFLCIHPIAVKGLVGAVLGIDRSKLYESTSNMKVGIRVLSPVQKDLQSVKLLTMKPGDGGKAGLFNFPSNVEFLRNLKYELFIAWDADKLDALEARLKNHTPIYTPCFGVTEHIAKLTFLDRCEAPAAQGETHVDSVVPIDLLGSVKFSDYEMFVDEIPVRNNEKREYVEYKKVGFAFQSGAVHDLKVDNPDGVFKVEDNNIYFF